MAFGALVGLSLVLTVFIVFPPTTNDPLAGCKRSFQIRVEWLCGQRVMYQNPDGSLVFIGSTKAPKVKAHLMEQPR